jgi:D-alanyl-D-alanine carboxypeptidase
MTCFVVILISETFNINLKKEKVIVNEKASKMLGTSAKLAYSDVCTIFDLLHGLMLPSGNDAAIALG